MRDTKIYGTPSEGFTHHQTRNLSDTIKKKKEENNARETFVNRSLPKVYLIAMIEWRVRANLITEPFQSLIFIALTS